MQRNVNGEQVTYDDEIDLRDLVMVLVEGWYWILGTVVLFVVVALAYVSVKTPTYETQFRAVPAPSANFSGFNLIRGQFSISPEDAFRALSNRLSSYQNFQEFFQQNQERFEVGEGSGPAQLFADRFSISGDNSEPGERLRLTVDYHYPEGEPGAELVNDYVRYTAEKVWVSLRDRFHDYNRAQVVRLETDLELQKGTLQQAREDRLFTLEQAITVARQLGIEKPTTPQQFGRQPSGSEVIYANISGDGSLPLYFMGHQALEAERDTLREEIDEGLSNGSIRDTQQQLQQHKRTAELLDSEALWGVDEGVEHNPSERVVEVVEYAFPPAQPSEPREALILALALLLGGMIGVMMAFMAKFVSGLRGYR